MALAVESGQTGEGADVAQHEVRVREVTGGKAYEREKSKRYKSNNPAVYQR